MTFEADRAYLEGAIGKLDNASSHPVQFEFFLRTSFERQFVEMSLHNRKINQEYIKRRLTDARPNTNKAIEQLEDFLEKNEEMRHVDAMLELRRSLVRGS